MSAWLRLRGVRWCPVASFVSPCAGWQDDGGAQVPAIIAVRIDRRPSSLDALSLELENGAVWRLVVRHVREVTGDAAHELVAELCPAPA